jgi:UDP-glucose 4-epimerase
MTWLITGGAGYIGSHVVETALARYFKIVVADNLVTGREKRLPADTPFLNASVSDDEILDFIQQHGVTGIFI